jgi:N-acetylmuramoyl-L-alanine amidase
MKQFLIVVVSGMIGAATMLTVMPETPVCIEVPTGNHETDRETRYLALTMWGEARGESINGMAAVGHVILNRVASEKYPNTIEGVVLQDAQFSCWDEPLVVPETGPDQRAWRDALNVAEALKRGQLQDPTGGHMMFHSILHPDPFWAEYGTYPITIGNHRFYREAQKS